MRRLRAAASGFELGEELELPERVVPHLLEECADRCEGVGSRAVVAEGAVAADVDQAGVGERPELEGDGTEGDVGHLAVDVSGGAFLLPYETEDLATPGRGDGGKNVLIEHALFYIKLK
jgi:hypothetical protein